MLGEEDPRETTAATPERRMNVVQLLGLALLVGVASAMVGALAGFGWGGLILLAWAGSVTGALGIAGIVYAVDRAREGSFEDAEHDAGGESLSALIDAWDEDLESDQRASRRRSLETEQEPEILPSSRGGRRGG